MDYLLVAGRLPDVLAQESATSVILSFARKDVASGMDMHTLPVLHGGRVYEIVPLPSGHGEMAFCSSAGMPIDPCHFSVRKLGWFERVARMAYQAVAGYVRLPAACRRAMGITLHGILFDLADTCRALNSLRFSWPRQRYEEWVGQFDVLSEADVEKIRQHIGRLQPRPRFRVCVLAQASSAAGALALTRDSLANQLYPDYFVDVLDMPLRIRDLAVHGDDWLLMLQAGDVLAPHALYEIACTVAGTPQAVMVYADHDSIDAAGRRHDPCFKPDWSMAHLRSTNYIGSAFALRGRNLVAAVKRESGDDEITPYDLLLRVGERSADTEVAHVPKVLLHRAWPAADAGDSGADDARNMAAVRAHLARRGIAAEVTRTRPGCWRVKYALPETPPVVSIIVPTRDACWLLRQCVESLLARTAYPRFEVLVVDNQSSDAETLAYLQELAIRPNVRVLRYDRRFNYSAINNFAVREARGELLCLLNNDTEVISPDWLEEMAGQLLQDDAGVVGAKLYYPDGRVQHAGDVLGVGGTANHLHAFIAHDAPGYCNRAVVVQALSAVTGACLLTKRALYERLGGLDERHLPVAFNDVDYCLRVREMGGKVIWTPHAELYHHESVSRGKDKTLARRLRAWREARYMRRRWRDAMRNDPFYNPNFSSARPDFVLGPVLEAGRPWLDEA